VSPFVEVFELRESIQGPFQIEPILARNLVTNRSYSGQTFSPITHVPHPLLRTLPRLALIAGRHSTESHGSSLARNLFCCWVPFGPSGTQSHKQMIDEATVSTMDSLRCLGFQPDPKVISEEYPGLTLDFGNLRLRASCCLNLRCVEVVLFTGVLSSPDSLADVFFEMPRKVKSLKQSAAWIVWSLDQCSEHRVFKPARHVGWIEEARTNQRLLPWVMSMAEFSASSMFSSTRLASIGAKNPGRISCLSIRQRRNRVQLRRLGAHYSIR
jgi:hypothetical protein